MGVGQGALELGVIGAARLLHDGAHATANDMAAWGCISALGT